MDLVIFLKIYSESSNRLLSRSLNVSKLKKQKVAKSHLTAEERKMGKNHIYILIGLIVIGLCLGLYYMN